MKAVRSLHHGLQAAGLLFWGALMLYFHASGRIAAFLHPTFRPWVLVAGVVLLLLAPAYLFALGRRFDACCEEGGCLPLDVSPGVWRWISLFLLVGPALGAALLSADGFSTQTILQRGVVTDAASLRVARARSLDEIAPLPEATPRDPAGAEEPGPALELPRDAEGRIQVELIDLLFGTQDATVRSDFENREVTVVGQLMEAREQNPTGDRLKLVRMFMVCCAADARPVSILFRKPDGFEAPQLSWVRVSGRATYPVEGGARIVLIDPAEVTPCEPPEESMLF